MRNKLPQDKTLGKHWKTDPRGNGKKSKSISPLATQVYLRQNIATFMSPGNGYDRREKGVCLEV